MTYGRAGDDTAIPVETELPDWLREAAPEDQPVIAEPQSKNRLSS